MDELVQRLSEPNQPVEVTVRPERTAQALKECLERGYVHVKFTETKGGTELGVRISPDDSDFSKADFDRGSGKILIVGELRLNYVPVRCVAQVDIETFQGSGHLEPMAEEPSDSEK